MYLLIIIFSVEYCMSYLVELSSSPVDVEMVSGTGMRLYDGVETSRTDTADGTLHGIPGS